MTLFRNRPTNCLKLRELRKRAGLTQQALAVRVGLSQSNISRMENGFRSVTLDQLFAIAEALRVPALELVREDPRIPSSISRTAHRNPSS